MYIFIKLVISALLITLISEAAKRSVLVGALLASLPITSLLSFVWIYYETRETEKIIALSYEIFWLVIPSLAFFLIFPLLLRRGLSFSASFLLAILGTSLIYLLSLFVLTKFAGRS